MRILDKRESLNLNLETPFCVLLEIGLSLSIKVDEKRVKEDEVYRANVVFTILHTEPISVSYPYSDDDFGYIALFLNPDPSIEWTKEQLISSFDWIWRIRKNIELVKNYNFGYPTPKNVNLVSPVYVYRYLLSKSYRTRYDSSFEEMIQLLQTEIYSKKYLHSRISCLLSICQKNVLQETYHNLLKKETEIMKNVKKLDLVKLSEIFDKIEARKNFDYYPSSNEEAVALAALNFRKDITSFPIPIFAYFDLLSHCFSQDDYAQKLLQKNPKIYDVSERFNPNFPMYVYLETELKKLCTDVGLEKNTRIEKNYNSLVSYHLLETFHQGIIPGVSLQTSILDENILEVDVQDVVTHGCFTTSFRAYTVEELDYMFSSNDYFYDPVEGIYSLNAIRSLEFLSRKFKTHQGWKKLCATITEIKRKASDLECQKAIFRTYYTSLNCADKKRASELLYSTLKISFIFRGWREGEPWPISKEIGRDNDETKNLALEPFQKYVLSFDLSREVDKKISSLPLIRIEPKTHKLLLETEVKNGLTLWKRIEIISEWKSGESCIRLSSGCLMATAYVFLSAIDAELQQKEDFQRIKITT